MLSSSDLWTKVEWVNFSLRFLDFFVKMWLLKACFLLILPVPVSLKRFLALDFVFILGIFLVFNSAYYSEQCSVLFFVCLWRNEHGHSLTLQFGHLLNFSKLFELLGKSEQQYLTLVLIDDGPSFKEHIGL